MPETVCPVNRAIAEFKETVESGQLSHPRSRRIAEEILQLLVDVAWGRAGQEHLSALESLAAELSDDPADDPALQSAAFIQETLNKHP